MRWGLMSLTIALVLLSGCGPSGPGEPVPTGVGGQRPAGSKRITMAFSREMDLAHHNRAG